MKKTIAYVDGFNLYFGMREKGWRRYYWLNLWELCQNLLRPDQRLIKVKYFTSKVKSPDDKRKRQNSYIKALRMTTGIELYFGKYETISLPCKHCQYMNEYSHEKMSDVQLATQFLNDAAKNRFDVALLICGDRDIVPAIEVCKSEYPQKRIIAAFPPLRACDDIRYIVDGYIHVTEKELKTSQLSPTVADTVGNTVSCPTQWV